MKKLILLALFGFAGWQAYHSHQARQQVLAAEPDNFQAVSPSPVGHSPAISSPESFKCDGRIYCSQMNSCAEAIYFLRNCPGTKMDGDHDGIPCEQQWCKG